MLLRGMDTQACTPLGPLRGELDWYKRHHRLTAWSQSLLAADPRPRRELADAIAAVYDAAVRPYWVQIEARLRADRAARARTIADAGLEHLLATVCPTHIRWKQPVLQVDTPLGCDTDVAAREIWTADRPAGRLAALVGRSRSAILESIADGCGTVELARRLGISPASVSHHTAVLRDSGLISTRRDGASVIHTLTSLGAILLDPDQGC